MKQHIIIGFWCFRWPLLAIIYEKMAFYPLFLHKSRYPGNLHQSGTPKMVFLYCPIPQGVTNKKWYMVQSCNLKCHPQSFQDKTVYPLSQSLFIKQRVVVMYSFINTEFGCYINIPNAIIFLYSNSTGYAPWLL